MNKINIKTGLLALLLLLLLAITAWLFVRAYYFSSFLFLTFSLAVFYEMITNVNRLLLAVEQTISSIYREDYSVKIPEKKFPPKLRTALQALNDIQKKRNKSTSSTRILYENIIESIGTGILILRAKHPKEIEIFYTNSSFSNLLEIPQFTRWHLMEPYLRSFPNILNSNSWRDEKDVLTLSINKKEQIFSFRTHLTKIYDSQYLIVHLDTLQSIIDKKEKEAWYNLMKVMSHEILNTITPINALAQNLDFLIDERREELGEDFSDIHHSIMTIEKRTQHLSDFVNTYRALTELPAPNKKQTLIKTVIENALFPLKMLIEENNIEIKIKINPDNLYFFIDAKQIEQVLVNLITNSVYALKDTSKAKILIRAYINERNCIEVNDNGVGISDEMKREVFVPFFTTRKNGSGIGLSLSKNIVQAHGGFLSFTSENGQTSFLIRI